MSDFIKKDDLVGFQIASYNDLVEHGLQEVIDERGKIDVDIPGYEFRLGRIRLGEPVVSEAEGDVSRYPFECRLRGFTYSAPIYLQFIERQKKDAICNSDFLLKVKEQGRLEDLTEKAARIYVTPGTYEAVRKWENPELMEVLEVVDFDIKGEQYLNNIKDEVVALAMQINSDLTRRGRGRGSSKVKYKKGERVIKILTENKERKRVAEKYKFEVLSASDIDNPDFLYDSRPIDAIIGKFPVMLRSKRCLLHGMGPEELIKYKEDPEDPGAYFIVNGTERVVIVVEDLAPNRIEVTRGATAGKEIFSAKVFSTRRGFRSRLVVEKKESAKGITLFVSFPGVPKNIPLTTLMKALGLDHGEILELFDDITKPEILSNLELDPLAPKDAFKYIGKRVGSGHAEQYQTLRAHQVLNNFVLPHVGTTEQYNLKKARYLAIMAKKVIELDLGLREPDDKDHYSNKRVRLAGDLLQELFRVGFNTLCRDIKYQLEKQNARNRKVNIAIAIRSKTLTERMEYALGTGNWSGGRAGISQVLDRTNYMSSISQRRRVTSLLSRSFPWFEARDLHATQWGRICPNETPEGQNCGLVKNLAIGAVISEESDDKVLEEYLEKFGVS